MSFHTFLVPYIEPLLGAAYNIQQAAEGYGVPSLNGFEADPAGPAMVSGLSPRIPLPILLGALMVYAAFLFVLILIANYVLGRKTGLGAALVVLLLPGTLSCFQLWPNIRYVPTKFELYGTGNTGELLGFLPLLGLGVLTGWALVIISYDIFRLSDRFRHTYDHFWYCCAILAGVFFVMDHESNKHKSELLEENLSSRTASAYLLRQVEQYANHCTQDHLEQQASCQWASRIQQTLNDYATQYEGLYYKVGPETVADLYTPFTREDTSNLIVQIRTEIRDYNAKICPVKQIDENTHQLARASTTCQHVPAQFCRWYPDPLNGVIDKDLLTRTVALGSECIVKMLVASREQQKKLSIPVDADQKRQHLRWLFFIAFSLFAGGKVANATAKLCNLDGREPTQQRRLWRLVIRVYRRIKVFFCWVGHCIQQGYQLMISRGHWAWTIAHASIKAMREKRASRANSKHLQEPQ